MTFQLEGVTTRYLLICFPYTLAVTFQLEGVTTDMPYTWTQNSLLAVTFQLEGVTTRQFQVLPSFELAETFQNRKVSANRRPDIFRVQTNLPTVS